MKHQKITVVLLGFLLLFGCTKRGTMTYNKGVYLFQSKEYQPALEKFTKAVEENPSFGEAYIGIGAVRKILAKEAMKNKEITQTTLQENLTPGKVPQALRSALSVKGINLSGSAKIEKVQNQWILSEEKSRYLLAEKLTLTKDGQKALEVTVTEPGNKALAISHYLAAIEAWKKAGRLFQLSLWRKRKRAERELNQLEKKQTASPKDKKLPEAVKDQKKKIKEIENLFNNQKSFVSLLDRTSSQEALLKELDEFLSLWENLPKKNSSPSKINEALLLSLIEKGDFFKGLQPYAEALKELSENTSGMEFFLNQSLPKKPLKKYREIQELLKQALKENPRFLEARLLLGMVEGTLAREYWKLSQKLPLSKKFLKKGPDPFLAAPLVEMTAPSLQKYSQKLMEKVLKNFSSTEDTFLILSNKKFQKEIEKQQGEIRKTVQILKGLEKTEKGIYLSFLNALIRQGGYIRGLGGYLKALRFYEQGRYEEALVFFPITQNPYFWEARYLAGCSLVQLAKEAIKNKEDKRARQLLSEALGAYKQFLHYVLFSSKNTQTWYLYSSDKKKKSLKEARNLIEKLSELIKKANEKEAYIREVKLGAIFDATW